MTNEKILAVLDLYDHKLRSWRPITSENMLRLRHAEAMIPKMRGYLAEGKQEKVFRWLGFLQGVLWCTGVYEIETMADHNRDEVK